MFHTVPAKRSRRVGVCGIGVNIPFKLMTSRMFAEWLCVDWFGGELARRRRGRGGLGGRAEDGLVRWRRRRCGREVFTWSGPGVGHWSVLL
jgi:hypothetical protein